MCVNSPVLSADDAAELKRSNSDLSDIPPQELARLRAGHRHALDVAEQILDGTRDPLSC